MIGHHPHRLSATTPRLGVWVVVALVLVGVWMTWRWVAFHTIANLSQDVGGSFELGDDDALAVAVMFSAPSKLGVDTAGPIYLRLGSDGAVTRIDRGQFNVTVDRAPMPPGWAWPGAIGVVYVRENDYAVAKVIRKTSTGLRAAAPQAEAIDFPIPSTATMGFRCYDGCGEAFPYPINDTAAIAGAVVFLVPVESGVETLIVFEQNATEPEALNFLKELVRWHQPVEATRTLSNGRRITERVPMSIDAIMVTINGSQTLIGNDTYSWTLIAADSAVMASTSANLAREYAALISTPDREHVASTLVLTKNVCGQRPSAFFQQDFSQAFANLSLTVTRGARSWSVCSNFR